MINKNDIYRVYVAGPMSGYVDFNRYKFDLISGFLNSGRYDGVLSKWPSQKTVALNPVDIDKAFRLDISIDEGNLVEWVPFLAQVNELSLQICDAVVLLPGWGKSKGAIHELALAHRLELDLYKVSEECDLQPVLYSDMISEIKSYA